MELMCEVSAQFPVAVIGLTGTLDAGSASAAEVTLWECLAAMPAALVLDASALEKVTPEGLAKLAELAESAARWPGVPVLFCGHEAADGHYRYLIGVPTASAAREVLAGVVLPAREEIQLAPHSSSCGMARDFVAAACHRWGLRRSSRLAELLTSELVANGVMHARTPLCLTIRRQDHSIEISVRDEDPSLLDMVSTSDPRGFGLQLVAQLSDSWGIAKTGSGKVVWSRLPGVG
jgi:anti-sigma regulatory factor (Ser/Thr protein kinase)